MGNVLTVTIALSLAGLFSFSTAVTLSPDSAVSDDRAAAAVATQQESGSKLPISFSITTDDVSVDPEEEEAVIDQDADLDGGWNTDKDVCAEYYDDACAALDKGLEDMVGVDYTPKELVGIQIVAGTNYKLLCDGTVVYPGAETQEYYITVYEDLDGNCTITDITEA